MWCVSTLQGNVTVTVVPDGSIITQATIVTLPNPDGDYGLEGAMQDEARASAIQIRLPGTITTGDSSTTGEYC